MNGDRLIGTMSIQLIRYGGTSSRPPATDSCSRPPRRARRRIHERRPRNNVCPATWRRPSSGLSPTTTHLSPLIRWLRARVGWTSECSIGRASLVSRSRLVNHFRDVSAMSREQDRVPHSTALALDEIPGFQTVKRSTHCCLREVRLGDNLALGQDAVGV